MDTRDLIQEREDLKAQILEAFLEQFEHYADRTETFEDILFNEEELTDFNDYWATELEGIEEINKLEKEVGSEFEYGVTLIEEDEFEDYCRELCEDCGYISRDFPHFIEIDWDATANNMRADYSETTFRGNDYLFR